LLPSFSTQPTLNRLADDRAKALADHEVDTAIADVLRKDATTKCNFHRVFAAPDDPISVDEAQVVSLVVISPAWTHAGKGAQQSTATEIVDEALTRCRSSQRRFRNTLLFVAADEAGLANAQEAMRKALAWESIVKDDRLQAQMTQAQAADAKERAKTHRDGAQKAVRMAWSHIFYPVRSETPGKPFDLEHGLMSSRDRAAIPSAVYEKVTADGIVLERLGPERLWLALGPIWPADRPHLPLAEVAGWFAEFAYLPKLRDKVVLETAIRDAVGKLDPQFGYADGYDEVTGRYRNLLWAKRPPDFPTPTAVLVRAAEALAQLAEATPTPTADVGPTQGPSGCIGWRSGSGASGCTSVAPPAPLLWFCRDRYGAAGEGVRRHPQCRGHGASADAWRKGEANVGNRGRGTRWLRRRRSQCRAGQR
jgi:hypothetical protein